MRRLMRRIRKLLHFPFLGGKFWTESEMWANLDGDVGTDTRVWTTTSSSTRTEMAAVMIRRSMSTRSRHPLRGSIPISGKPLHSVVEVRERCKKWEFQASSVCVR